MLLSSCILIGQVLWLSFNKTSLFETPFAGSYWFGIQGCRCLCPNITISLIFWGSSLVPNLSGHISLMIVSKNHFITILEMNFPLYSCFLNRFQLSIKFISHKEEKSTKQVRIIIVHVQRNYWEHHKIQTFQTF